MAITRYRYNYNLLTGWGFLPFESREFARQYTVAQLRTVPYLKSMIRWRRLYVSNFRSRGYGDREIIDRIYALYDTRDWLTPDGQVDPWRMLRRFRKQAIEDTEYIPPKRNGGGHHPMGVSKGDVAGQRKRRKARTPLEKYAQGRGKE